MKKVYKKRLFILSGMVVLLVCVGFIGNRFGTPPANLETALDYVNYEEQQLLKHDGEVLVDSLNLTAISGGKNHEKEGDAKTGLLVTSDEMTDLSDADSYFGELRATLNMDRNEIISMLSGVIEEAPDGAEKTNATKQKLKLIEYMEKENTIESLLENKGFIDAFVVITDTSVNVTVNKQELTKSDVAKILDIVVRETGRNPDQIVIQPKF
ncbi:MAG: SpoIIIAH-like family protein [Anaerovoracaceae bacterium]|jgi:stage III sporulation protein AH